MQRANVVPVRLFIENSAEIKKIQELSKRITSPLNELEVYIESIWTNLPPLKTVEVMVLYFADYEWKETIEKIKSFQLLIHKLKLNPKVDTYDDLLDILPAKHVIDNLHLSNENLRFINSTNLNNAKREAVIQNKCLDLFNDLYKEVFPLTSLAEKRHLTKWMNKSQCYKKIKKFVITEFEHHQEQSDAINNYNLMLRLKRASTFNELLNLIDSYDFNYYNKSVLSQSSLRLFKKPMPDEMISKLRAEIEKVMDKLGYVKEERYYSKQKSNIF